MSEAVKSKRADNVRRQRIMHTQYIVSQLWTKIISPDLTLHIEQDKDGHITTIYLQMYAAFLESITVLLLVPVVFVCSYNEQRAWTLAYCQ